MKRTVGLILILILILFNNTIVFGNSAPMLMEEDPAFTLAPMGSTPIAVHSEYLEFDLSSERGDIAKVTAIYEMVNTSKEKLTQKMVFPFITSYWKGFREGVSITVNDRPIDFRSYRLDDVPFRYSNELHFIEKESRVLSEKIAIENIVKMLNERDYQPKHFDLNQRVTIYTLELPRKDQDYRAEISFKVTSKEHRIMHQGFNGMSYNNDGSGTLSAWVPFKDNQNPWSYPYIVAFGETEGSRIELSFTSGYGIKVEEVVLNDYLEDYFQLTATENNAFYEEIGIITLEKNSQFMDDLRNYTYKQLDSLLYAYRPAFSFSGDVLSPYFNNDYVGAFVYEVEFEPEERSLVKVEYTMRATRDRRKSSGFTNLFLYLLDPAKGWKEFKDLNIKVIPNAGMPYILESSLPLEKDNGIYTAHFSTLPQDNFYFITYHKDKLDPPVISRNWVYALYFLGLPVLLAVAMIAIFYLFYRNIKRHLSKN